MPSVYYYFTHAEYQQLQQGIRVLKGRTHQGILDKTGKSEESRFVKYAVLEYARELISQEKERQTCLSVKNVDNSSSQPTPAPTVGRTPSVVSATSSI